MTIDVGRIHEAKVHGGPIASFAASDGRNVSLRGAYPSDPAIRERDIEAFATLRRLHADAFFDTAAPSPEEVRRWVNSRYDRDQNQINFVAEEGEEILLFCGLSEIDPESGRAEFGRLMRSPEAPRGLARTALPFLLAWAREIGIKTIDLEVFADNEPARQLYESVGFRFDHEFRRTPVEKDGRILWVRGAGNDDRAVVAMRCDLMDSDKASGRS